MVGGLIIDDLLFSIVILRHFVIYVSYTAGRGMSREKSSRGSILDARQGSWLVDGGVKREKAKGKTEKGKGKMKKGKWNAATDTGGTD